MANPFRALQATETGTGTTLSIVTRSVDELPQGDVLVRVHYSSLNYKDALSASGHKGVTRQYPHTPGIDAAGVVEASAVPEWKPGDEVIVTGFDLGMNTSGGFSEYVRVPADWVIALPPGLTLRESMCYGTAGFTAGQSVRTLLRHGLQPGDGNIVVTGASGGVGSLSVAILSRLGYRVTAVTSKEASHAFLSRLGAADIIPRHEMEDASGKPLLKQRFAGAIDTVGGDVLTTVLRSLRYGGIAATCGNVSGNTLSMTVLPFILRGVHLAGIASADLPRAERLPVWQALAGDWKPAMLGEVAHEISLDQLPASIDRILHGQMEGRALVKL